MSVRRLLVVGTIDRPDIIAMFRDLRGDCDLHFVEYFYNYGIPTDVNHYADYGHVHFWHAYRHAGHLLDALKPDRVVLFYISSLNQVALRVVARDRGIPVFHLEHGFRERFGAASEGELMARPHSSRFDQRKLRRELGKTVGNHGFFLRSLPVARKPYRSTLAGFGARVYARGVSPSLLLRYAEMRRADRYIAFSPEFFDFHRVQDDVRDWRERVTCIGIPQFDAYAKLVAGPLAAHQVALIDHQFHNADMFGWTLESRRVWVARLASLVHELGLRLYVKLHPGDSSGVWGEHISPGRIEIVDRDGLFGAMQSTSIVLGFVSTMQLPLAALRHTALLTWENDPGPGRFASRQLVGAGVAHAVRSFEELRAAIANIDAIRARQQAHKASFIKQFLLTLDGRAGERLRRELVER